MKKKTIWSLIHTFFQSISFSKLKIHLHPLLFFSKTALMMFSYNKKKPKTNSPTQFVTEYGKHAQQKYSTREDMQIVKSANNPPDHF